MKRPLAIVFAVLFAALPAHAQYGVPGADGAVSIAMSPRYPGPQQAVSLSLSSGLYDLDSSSIVWRANGIVIAQGTGVTSASLTTGAIGEETDVTVQVDSDAGSASTELTIIPTRVDLLWESGSYVPPFYLGRALPSSGASITLVAMPQFGASHVIAPSSLIYTWRKDGDVLGSLSGRGKSSATIDGPMLYGTTAITVDVTSADGSIAGEASVTIPDQPAALILYEDHPLFGVLYHQALSDTVNSPETEASFVAVPYFAPISGTGDPLLTYDWTVNQSAVTPDKKHPNEVTLNSAKSAGVALVKLALSHAANFFFSPDATWNVTLNASPSGQTIPGNPFDSQQH